MTAALLLESNCSSMGARHRSKESCSWAPHRDVHDTVHTARNADKQGLPDLKECSYDEREEMQKGTPRDKKNISLSTCWQRWYLRDKQIKKHERDAYSGLQTEARQSSRSKTEKGDMHVRLHTRNALCRCTLSAPYHP